MCGIVALYASGPVNQRLYDALLLLQHRGQDAAGICTVEGRHFHMHKGMGLVRDVFRTRNMRDLLGNCGIGQVRYPTQGNATAADISELMDEVIEKVEKQFSVTLEPEIIRIGNF